MGHVRCLLSRRDHAPRVSLFDWMPIGQSLRFQHWHWSSAAMCHALKGLCQPSLNDPTHMSQEKYLLWYHLLCQLMHLETQQAQGKANKHVHGVAGGSPGFEDLTQYQRRELSQPLAEVTHLTANIGYFAILGLHLSCHQHMPCKELAL
eukprot:TRINITY_DN54154_c0_g1_i1.p2 TRINITY_DN54154_c0_g1~~TRINITY_DN54154_c0_g1_i1.p2  ORF type:complete len:149 (+),score=18.42 TRINITY_DN54154_c0_g1_i1:286-732(+)